MTDATKAAHDALIDLFVSDGAAYGSAMGVAIAFHDWAEEQGHDVAVTELREKHVYGEMPLDERCAALVLEWVDE